jgi:hypothetical protein
MTATRRETHRSAPAPRHAIRQNASEKTASSGDTIAFDLLIEIDNEPGALASVAAAISDAGVNLAAATCVGTADRVELHVLVPHAEAARHALAISHLGVTREREVVVVEVEDRPGVLADLTRKVGRAGVNLDLVYVATRNRLVFGSPDLEGLKAALAPPG